MVDFVLPIPASFQTPQDEPGFRGKIKLRHADVRSAAIVVCRLLIFHNSRSRQQTKSSGIGTERVKMLYSSLLNLAYPTYPNTCHATSLLALDPAYAHANLNALDNAGKWKKNPQTLPVAPENRSSVEL